jgi:uncharacterized iron-regulated membrane protein
MEDNKRSAWKRIRKFFNDVHLWLGLASGLIVIVVCFSGTIYVYQAELKEWSAPELYTVEQPADATPLALESVIHKLEKEKGGKATVVKVFDSPTKPWHISIKADSKEEKPERRGEGGKREAGVEKSRGENRAKDGEGERKRSEESKDKKQAEGKPAEAPRGGGGRPNMGTVYAVNQYTGEIIGDVSGVKNGTTEFLRTLFSLHRWLMLDRVEEPLFGELPNRKLGSYITGTATILFTLGVLTGMVIWFPQKLKTWKQGLKIKWDANWKRINHDIHNTLAFYSLLFLFLMGVTGPQWSFEWYREGLQKSLGTYQAPDTPRPTPPKSTVPVDSLIQQVGLERIVTKANTSLAYAGDVSITLPNNPEGTYTVTKNKTGFFAPAASDRIVIDQYSAEVLSLDRLRDKPFNERVASSIKALHVGDVYGQASKLLYFLSCLIATSLPITGTIIWINKLAKKRKRARKHALKPSVA